MKKFIILIPVYNDWKSLEKLMLEINEVIKNIGNAEFNFIIINDSSTEPHQTIKVPPNIFSIKVINMKKNKGHARCNAFGIRYLAELDNFDYTILMDGDGEDRPEELKPLVLQAIKDENISIVAKRVKRSEGFFFQLLYKIHKIITLVFTGKNINFGNFSCLTKKDIKILSTKESLWSSFSGSLKKHIPNLNSINSMRGLRYFGPSKMSLFNLIVHSFSIIAVFKKNVFLRSSIAIFFLSYFFSATNLKVIILQFLLVSFSLIIFVVSLRENKKDFLKSSDNEQSSKTYTH
jgi:hypothetical protein